MRSSGIGGSVRSFTALGEQQLRYCIELADLKPDATLLEVGCGMGRLAAALTKYLSQTGKYEGLDITRIGVGWCQRKITSKYPNFRFHLVDAFNNVYNPKGKTKQSEYEFPYSDESFDLIFSYSVFTHMVLEDTTHYLSEISRVLKTGGTSINTFLLLNSESRSLMEAGQSSFNLKYQLGFSRFAEKDLPESTIAHDETEVRSAYLSSGMQIAEPIRHGGWPGRRKSLDGQDIIIARKVASGPNQAYRA
jgi:ubiquinone/menaquinone biosynthesis C-methylase UbiE